MNKIKKFIVDQKLKNRKGNNVPKLSEEEIKRRMAIDDDTMESLTFRATLKDPTKLVVLDANIWMFQNSGELSEILMPRVDSQDTWCVWSNEPKLIDITIQMQGFSAYIFEKGAWFLCERLEQEQRWRDEQNGIYRDDDEYDEEYDDEYDDEYDEEYDEEEDYNETEEDLWELPLRHINCELRRDKQTLFTNYLNLVFPMWKNVAKVNPVFPDYFAKDETLLYSLVLLSEQIALFYSENMELWSVLPPKQQTILRAYATRFMDYLKSEKQADEKRVEELLTKEGLTMNDLIPNFPVIKQVEVEETSDICEFIIPNDLKSQEEIEKEMRKAAEQPASVLADYIKRALKLGYLDFGKLSMPKVFDKLQVHFQISYGYDNFRKAYANA